MKLTIYGVVVVKNESNPIDCVGDIEFFTTEEARENFSQRYEGSEYHFCEYFTKEIEIN